MEPASWFELGAAAASLLLVALAAATESVLAQISRQQLRQLAEGSRRTIRSIDQLIARPRAYVAAMTLIHTFGATAFALLVAAALLRQGGPATLWIAFAIAAPAILFFGHSLPRSLARRSVERAAAGLAGFAVLATALAAPLLGIYDGLTRIIFWALRRTPVSAAPEPANEEELQAVLGPEYASGDPIEEEEREMIDAILDLEERTARDIMVPRLDIIAVPADMPLAEVVETIRRAGHSRIPVYRESVDDVIGVVYAKDLLRLVPRDIAPVPLEALLRPMDFVIPESKTLDVLLREMQLSKRHLALVADEYGGTAGLVTIEDILEEIVGEIQDEHDTTVAPAIEEVSERELLVDARISAEEVSDWLDLRWTEEEEHITLAGLVQRELGRLPEAGEVLDFGGAHITVLEVDGNRLERLRVEKVIRPNGNGNGHADGNGRAGAGEQAGK